MFLTFISYEGSSHHFSKSLHKMNSVMGAESFPTDASPFLETPDELSATIGRIQWIWPRKSEM